MFQQHTPSRPFRAVAVVTPLLIPLLLGACEGPHDSAPPAPAEVEDGRALPQVVAANVQECRAACGPMQPCDTLCDANPREHPDDPPGHLTTCEFYQTGWCGQMPTGVGADPPSSPGLRMPGSSPDVGGAANLCTEARPWEVTFWQHFNYNAGHPPFPLQQALCRSFSTQT